MTLLFDHHPVTLPVTGRAERFPVRRVYCVGRNYVDHVREMREGDERDDPFFFQKPTDAVVTGPTVPYPPGTTDFQYEGELVVAIGTETGAVAAADALDAVFGYAAGIDLTRRDRQRDARARQVSWEAGKAFDHSAPCGSLTPRDEAGDVPAAVLRLEVNGAERQRTALDLMIWTVPEIVAWLSRDHRLMPGDLIYTGTPAGVGALERGDRVVVTVDALAPLTIEITDDGSPQ